MLGVRRVGVTGAASRLQREGVVDDRRGHDTVLDRARQEQTASSGYQSDRSSYAAVL